MASNNNDLSEEWVAYRKLVIETLSKLDERSLELYDRVADLAGRVTALEKNRSPAQQEISNLDDAVDELDTEMKDALKRIDALEDRGTNEEAIRKAIKLTVGIFWTVTTVVIGWAISYFTNR